MSNAEPRIIDLPIGLALRSIRLQRKLSQRTLAHRAKVPRTYISKLENKSATPTLNSVFRICEALRVKPWVFVRFVYRMHKALAKDPQLKNRLLARKIEYAPRKSKGVTHEEVSVLNNPDALLHSSLSTGQNASA